MTDGGTRFTPIVQSDWRLVEIPRELFPAKWETHRWCWLPPVKG